MFSVNALGPLDLDHAVLYCVSGGFVPWTTMEHARYILVPHQDDCIQRSVMISMPGSWDQSPRGVLPTTQLYLVRRHLCSLSPLAEGKAAHLPTY